MKRAHTVWIVSLVECWMLAAGGCGEGSGSRRGGRAAGQKATPAPRGAPPREDSRATKALRVGARLPPAPRADAPREGPIPLAPPTEPGSWRTVRPVAVYTRPDTSSPIRGAVKAHTRLARTTRVKGKGCEPGFLRLGPRAFVCRHNLRKDRRPPSARKQPTLGANHLTPGTYGYIRTGGAKLYWTLEDGFRDRKGKPIKQSDTVRWAGKRFFRGMKFWRITDGHFIRGDRVRRFWPSRFAGVRLDDAKRSLPLVFMVSRRRRHIAEAIPPVDVLDRPGGKVVSTLPRYSAWPVDHVRRGPAFRWFRIPGKGWVSSEMVRLVRLTDPPPGLHPAERWIDVDLEEETLVAYRGRRPVYATLVAAGVWKYPTPRGVFRITRKVAEADMRSDASASETYRVDHVPWTMYFKGGYALHGAYWHDGFGHAKSHGCVNLSPRDARFVYWFTRPIVPDGWTKLVSDPDHPGTAVRIRGRENPPVRRANKETGATPSQARRTSPAPPRRRQGADSAHDKLR